MEPQSVAEKFCDTVAVVLAMIGFFVIAGETAGNAIYQNLPPVIVNIVRDEENN